MIAKVYTQKLSTLQVEELPFVPEDNTTKIRKGESIQRERILVDHT